MLLMIKKDAPSSTGHLFYVAAIVSGAGHDIKSFKH
ncbi:hypothetical protein JOC76_003851 [Neobacillus cucumis]|nr:hypothetical protein [Neobacillus cucumis]